ncbi:precorrin-4 C(11)-methyltransferase [Thermosediminibacter oceani]|uniref:Precorrin-4 C11-methyltransferase n=1 Tax=Thermosediminibacter oceani (strain ATCC BAA-1034 / DSM 16646 / JW/IW-1228P) TaxID=555079 RepID=D9S0T2_THEOJ|nr:precorrin-4 C(11)-methyltransferase [Thermosediminibacter oceani]ADL07096.1 precorrin-4 C11-methyltransferase [Thermosediminibacter oceani DSM 16646]
MIYFIGAGPGDPDLITVKGANILASCGVVIYAGSLVNPDVLRYARRDARVYDSSGMNLEEIIDVMKSAHGEGLDVARLHTGDPSIYSAVREQAEMLKKLGIPFEIIPGVSSFTAAAAVLKSELTVPGVSQTVIITRVPGRTPVPERERLKSLAAHRATMAVFLSADRIKDVADELIQSYGPKTPVAVVYRATWEDQKVVRGTLEDIAGKVEEEGIKRTAVIIVGEALGDAFEFSKLYDPSFSHGFRSGTP